jgi:hypothetical protein
VTTTLRLIRDVATRGRLAFAFGAAMLFVLTLLSESAMSRQTTFACLMMVSAYIAIGVPMFLLNQREVAQLPASRLETWRVRTVVAVSFPLAIGLAAKLTALAFRRRSVWPTPADAVVSSFIDVVFGLSLLGLAAAWPVGIAPLDTKNRRLSLMGLFAVALLYLSPLIFKTYIPRSWNQIDAAEAMFLGALSLLGVKGFVHSPGMTPRASPPRMSSGIRKTPMRSWPGDSVTGLTRLFMVHARQIALMAPMAFATIWFIQTFTEGTRSGSIRDLLHELQLMPFDVGYATNGKHGFNLLMFIFVAVGDKPRELMQRVRALRVMPMTANRLSLMFAGLALAEALVVWLWLIGIHVAIAGSVPATLRMDIFTIFCGALTLTRAIESLFLSSFGGRLVGMVAFMVPVALVTMWLESAQTVMLIVGLASFGAGITLQAQVLRRRQKLYKFKPPTFFGRPFPS